MKKPIRVILIDEAQAAHKKLNNIVGEQKAKGIENTKEIQLLKNIQDKVNLLKANPFYGNNIPKQRFRKHTTYKIYGALN